VVPVDECLKVLRNTKGLRNTDDEMMSIRNTDDDDDDDEYKPVWPQGWPLRQARRIHINRTHPSLRLLAIHFVKVKWYLWINVSRC
jgi:hypothetical protein